MRSVTIERKGFNWQIRYRRGNTEQLIPAPLASEQRLGEDLMLLVGNGYTQLMSLEEGTANIPPPRMRAAWTRVMMFVADKAGDRSLAHWAPEVLTRLGGHEHAVRVEALQSERATRAARTRHDAVPTREVLKSAYLAQVDRRGRPDRGEADAWWAELARGFPDWDVNPDQLRKRCRVRKWLKEADPG